MVDNVEEMERHEKIYDPCNKSHRNAGQRMRQKR